MESRCHQVPRMPRKVSRWPGRLTGPKRATKPYPLQWCHDQTQPSAISATPATQMQSRCHEAPRLPRKAPEPSARSATPATQNKGRLCWKMVRDKVVCERECVTKMCVWKFVLKDGAWQRFMWKKEWQCCVCVCVKVCVETWRVIKLCVKESVTKWCVKVCVER